MEDFLKREDAFAGAELALYPHANFTDGLVKVREADSAGRLDMDPDLRQVCAELKVEEFYPHLKDLVAVRLGI